MRIAVIGNFDKEIKPNSRGGIELFTYLLVAGLIKSPEISSITLFGVGNNYFNHSKVEFVPILPAGRVEFTQSNHFLSELAQGRADFDAELRLGIATKIIKELISGKVDLIHDNSASLVFTSLSSLLPAPIVTTLHTNVMSPSVMIPYSLGLLDGKSTKQYFVSIARHQQQFVKQNNIDINVIENIYNGIEPKDYIFDNETSNNSYGLWLGRVKRKHDKGLREAILASEGSGKNLHIVAQIDDQEFFKNEIQPSMAKYSSIIKSPENLDEKQMIYGKAAYFLYPVQWEEPFGLVFLEAMTCGTPVIAFARGAVPEIIVDGVTGFIINPSDDDIRGDWIIKKTGVDGLREAIERISSLSKVNYEKMRQACRKHVEENFTVEKMVENYEKVYKKVIEASR